VAVLIVEPPEDLGAALIERLVAQDDEVRVVAGNELLSRRWKALEAHVASGSGTDVDLLERAAQDVRTVVMFWRPGQDEQALGTVIEAMQLAGVERLVIGTEGSPKLSALLPSDMDHVILGSPSFTVRRRRFLGAIRNLPSVQRLAEAVDAADDLAGHPRLELDLQDPAAWERLGLLQ
jgi:NAD(P)H-binding